MARKLKADAAKPDPTKASDAQLAEAVRASAHEIWLAGLGAFQKAQEEGNKAFDKLVREGQSLHHLTRELAQTKMTEAATRLSEQTATAWDKLESAFEERVARAMDSLGIPSAREMEALRVEIATLRERVAALETARQAVARKAAPRKKTSSTNAKPTA